MNVKQNPAAWVLKTLSVIFSEQYITYQVKCFPLDKYLKSVRSEITLIIQ